MSLHNNTHIFFFLSILSLLFSSCTTKEVAEEIDSEDDFQNTATVLIDGFYPGDEVTRSTLTYGSGGLKFSWELEDHFGIYPTGKITNNGHSNNNPQASQEPFTLTTVKDGGLDAHISSDNSYFHFLSNYRYSAYTPYNAGEINFDNIPFEFPMQTQRGYVNMGEYNKKTGGGFSNPIYMASEALACQHLGAADILISPETVSDERPLHFYMRHIGAIARFYLKTPTGKRLKLKEIKLIASDKIFYTRGSIDLTSHPFNASLVPSTALPTRPEEVKNYGVVLPQASVSQISPEESSKTDCLTLKFDDGTNNGVWNNCPATDGEYILAYLMMYPINYDNTQASAYIYVIAEDEAGNELHYRTTKLASKYMCSGYLYQWTKSVTDIYPIELTATLQSWQEVASGAIETDLEK